MHPSRLRVPDTTASTTNERLHCHESSFLSPCRVLRVAKIGERRFGLRATPDPTPRRPSDTALLSESSLYPTSWNIVFRALWKYLPEWMLDYIRYIPTREYTRIMKTVNVISRVSRKLIEEKTSALLAGNQDSRDVLSVLGE